ncbi:hypothetical protein MIR68_003950 [Amoeboaphelidium protococcarum]|nr:hypothetical protein MIR68_003950 [Amoeboaphelidium protococcarum]
MNSQKVDGSIDAMLVKAEDLLLQQEYETAILFAQPVVDQLQDGEEADITQLQSALEIRVQCEMELHQYERAIQTWLRIIEHFPDNFQAYLYLGQLHAGKQSVEYIEQGIQRCQQQLIICSDDSLKLELQFYISNAYCSLVDIYMSDLCFEEDAEQRCNQYASSAIQSCESNPDAYMTMASLQLTIKNIDQAKQFLLKSVSLWIPQDILEVCNDISSQDYQLMSPMSDMPQYESRSSLVRQLMECELFDVALIVIESLLGENDVDLSVLHCKALTYWSMALQNITVAVSENTVGDSSSVDMDESQLLELLTSGNVDNIQLDQGTSQIIVACKEVLEQVQSIMQDGEIELALDDKDLQELLDLYAIIAKLPLSSPVQTDQDDSLNR